MRLINQRNLLFLCAIFFGAYGLSQAHVNNCGIVGDPKPRALIDDYCRAQHWTCVADLTAGTQCGYYRGIPPPNFLEDLAKTCPSYGWKVIENVHFFGPNDESDSKLNVLVGPINGKKQMAFEVLYQLETQANLPARGPTSGDCAGISRKILFPNVKKRFRIPRDKFRDNLIRAARQFGPSFWAVECYNSGCGSNVDDYDDLPK